MTGYLKPLRTAAFATLLAGALALVMGGTARAEPAPDRDARLRAAFLFQFTRYVEWPDIQDRFRILIVNSPGLASALRELLTNKTYFLDEVTLPFELKEQPDAASIGGYQLVFLPAEQLKRLDAQKRPESTLIVSEGKGLASNRAHISFFVDGERLRFAITRKLNMPSSRLRASSQLLKLALLVD